jgi:hypothetical protein
MDKIWETKRIPTIKSCSTRQNETKVLKATAMFHGFCPPHAIFN